MTLKKEKGDLFFRSDKKKYNLDGRDGLAFTWHDLRKGREYVSKQDRYGESIMGWTCLVGHKISKLISIIKVYSDVFKLFYTVFRGNFAHNYIYEGYNTFS